jgi:polysaccharide deacetylase 2 family uncharacterized protein YibQ
MGRTQPDAEPAATNRLRLPRLPLLSDLSRLIRPARWPTLPNREWWSPGKSALATSFASVLATLLLFTALSFLGKVLAPQPAVVELVLPDEQRAPPPSDSVGIDGGIVVPRYTAAAFAGLPELPAAAREKPLTPAPDPALVEETPIGALPRVAADGRQARLVYARPFDVGDRRARLSIIVSEIGLSRIAGEAAIHRLPGPVVMAISAYAASPEHWAQAARRAGHEIVASIPLQPQHRIGEDAGPRALRPAAAPQENMQRLLGNLARFSGYTGILLNGDAASLGSVAEPLLQSLRTRGLLFVNGATSSSGSPLATLAGRLGLAYVSLNIAVDTSDAAVIDRQLDALATLARQRSYAVATIQPTPVALERLRGFLSGLDAQHFVLAPVSAVVTAGGER